MNAQIRIVRRLLPFALACGLLAALTPAARAARAAPLDIVPGFRITPPPGWKEGDRTRNSFDLVKLSPRGDVLALTQVTTEEREGHEEALKRLADIVAEVPEPAQLLVIPAGPRSTGGARRPCRAATRTNCRTTCIFLQTRRSSSAPSRWPRDRRWSVSRPPSFPEPRSACSTRCGIRSSRWTSRRPGIRCGRKPKPPAGGSRGGGPQAGTAAVAADSAVAGAGGGSRAGLRIEDRRPTRRGGGAGPWRAPDEAIADGRNVVVVANGGYSY